jgi:phenylalanyl-tRNA synthetase alpha chain
VNKGELSEYLQKTMAELNACQTQEALEQWHHAQLSRSGLLSQLKKKIGQLPVEERKAFGQAVNELADVLTEHFFERQNSLKLIALEQKIRQDAIDITLPSRTLTVGGLHPVTQMLREVIEIFAHMGFSVYESSEIETDEFCFQLLNIPKDHPARDMQDTFFVSDDTVLRTHTSPGQIHVMREFAPHPVQVILPGRVYRVEDINPRSEIQFHQIEGLLVGEQVRFSDLKGILLRFVRYLYGDDQEIRLRGSYFPFTEPSVEVDIRCSLCKGRGCRLCKHSGWLELLGAGLVHPVVLENGGYDSTRVQGIAFGLGVERLVLMRYQIEDIRYFCQNDHRFLSQFC